MSGLRARIDRVEAKVRPGGDGDELKWWLSLLCPEGGGPIPPRPKTRHITLEMIVIGEESGKSLTAAV